MRLTENEIIEKLDNTPRPYTKLRYVACALLSKSHNINELDRQAILICKSGGHATADQQEELIVAEGRVDIDVYDKAKLSLISAILRENGNLDGYIAEYIFNSAKDMGLFKDCVDILNVIIDDQ